MQPIHKHNFTIALSLSHCCLTHVHKTDKKTEQNFKKVQNEEAVRQDNAQKAVRCIWLKCHNVPLLVLHNH